MITLCAASHMKQEGRQENGEREGVGFTGMVEDRSGVEGQGVEKGLAAQKDATILKSGWSFVLSACSPERMEGKKDKKKKGEGKPGTLHH